MIAHFLAQILNGLGYGLMISILAVGLSLVFGMLKVLNFAHGALYAIGAYLAFTICGWFSGFIGNFWIAVVFVPVIVGIVGLLLEVILLRPMYARAHHFQLLITFGLALVIQEVILLIYGHWPLTLAPPRAFTGLVNLGLFDYPQYRLFIIIFGAAVIFASWYFVERTKFGSIIRAATEDAETASGLGVNVRLVYTSTFALGAALAGLGGVIGGPLVHLKPVMGMDIIMDCFVVVVVGGMGTIPGALLGGIIIGFAKSITALFWPTASVVVMFAVMAIILLVKPKGLLGKIWW